MKIPKIFHRIWLGHKKFPERFRNYGNSWVDHHPDFEFLFWKDEDVPELINQDLFDKARTYAEKSDILRMEILKEHGGIYIDTDIECYKNIEKIIRPVDFFIVKDSDHWSKKPPYNIPYLNNAFMGCTINHPLMNKLIEDLPCFYIGHLESHVCMRTGPGYFSFMLKDEPIFVPPVVIFNGIYARHHYTNSWQDIEPQPKDWPK